MKRLLALLCVLTMMISLGASAFAGISIGVSPSGAGSVTPVGDPYESANYETDQYMVQKYRASSNQGFHFVGWQLGSSPDYASVSAEIDLDIYDRNVTAVFAEDEVNDDSSSENSQLREVNNNSSGNSENENIQVPAAPAKAPEASSEKHTISVSVSPEGAGYIDAGDGYKSSDTITVSFPDVKVVPISARSTTGFVFTGWFDKGLNAVVSTKSDEIFDIDRDRELVAQFKEEGNTPVDPDPYNPPPPADDYIIYYEPGAYGREGTAARESYFPDTRVEGQLFTRNGYTQTGWSRRDGGYKDYQLYDPIRLESKVTYLYPYWEQTAGPLWLTLRTVGNGVVRLNGTNLYDGWGQNLWPNTSLTFTFVPGAGNYVYSLLLAGWYRQMNYGNQFTVDYNMMRGADQTLTVRFASVYSPPKTGDNSNLALWIALGGLSAVALGALIFMKKKK